MLGTTLILTTICTSAHATGKTNITSSMAKSDVTAKLLADKFDAGEYWTVGTEGLTYLKSDPGNNELRIKVADSLAWTGRYPDAISQYQALKGTNLSDRAALGLANVYRWNDRPDLASTLYQQVIKSSPADPDAVDGMRRTDRELRPKTRIEYVRKSDSNAVMQNGVGVTHRWRGDNLALKYELSLDSSRYTLSPLNVTHREVSLSAEHTGMALSPRLELSAQQSPSTRIFGSLRLKLDNTPDLYLTVGHLNWGLMAFQPQALLQGLNATQLGAEGNLITRPGTISGAYNVYRISDGNQIQDVNIKFSPSWHPLGIDFRYYIGLSGHYALQNVPTYWSPAGGYLSTDIGFTYEWSSLENEYFVYGQRGFRQGGEALDSYNMGLAAKRYIDRDWAATLGTGLNKNQLVNAYHSKFLTLGVERLW